MKNHSKNTNVLIINGHPDKASFCAALAKAYQQGVMASSAKHKLFHLSDLEFDPILHQGYRVVQEPEPDLMELKRAIMESDHLVLIYPVWWMNCPALLKGMFDRIFLPGSMYSFKDGTYGWERHMKGKSARLILTMDTPPLIFRLLMKRPADLAVSRGTLRFCGYGPVRRTFLGSVKRSSEQRRARWLNKIEKLGQFIR